MRFLARNRHLTTTQLFFQKNCHLDTLGGAKGFRGGQIPVFLITQKVQLLEQ